MIDTQMTLSPSYTYAVQFQDISKSFSHVKQDTPVLDKINGTIRQGSITTLVGPSGSGKSTLLSLCNLLLTPDSGQLYIQGKEIQTWAITELRRNVGIVFQDAPMVQGTALYNLQTSQRLHGTDIGNPATLVEQVGLSAQVLHQQVQDLSGGQKQRLALARTLANQPQILLLDEITSALDPSSVREVEQLLLDIQRESGITLIWVTHQMEQAQRVGQETWFLMNGQLLEQRPTADFFAHPQTEEAQRFIKGELQ